MELRFLEEFVSLVETCSFQETAEQLLVSQSSLTKHIQRLEEELGVTLFDRSTRSVKLNNFSLAFYPYAKKIIDSYAQGIQELNELKADFSNSLHFAFTPGAAQYGIVELTSQFKKHHPDIDIKLTETYAISDFITQKSCDFAFITEETVLGNGICRLPYFTDRLAAVVGLKHRLSGEESVSLTHLTEENFIIHAKPDGSYHLETKKFLGTCKKLGISPKIVAKASFTSTIAKMVAENQGIAILNQHQFPTDITSVKVIPLEPKVESYVYLIYPQITHKTSQRQFFNF